MRLKGVKVRDLVKCSSGFLTDMEVVIRDKGKWVYGWRIGPHAKIYRYEHCAEYREQRGQFGIDAVKLKPGEYADVTKWPPDGCPMTVMCVKPEEAPEEVLDLEVNYYQPRYMPEFHGEQLTHNDFSLEIVCNVPDLMIAPEKIKEFLTKSTDESLKDKLKLPNASSEDIEGQMSLDQFYQTEKV